MIKPLLFLNNDLNPFLMMNVLKYSIALLTLTLFTACNIDEEEVNLPDDISGQVFGCSGEGEIGEADINPASSTIEGTPNIDKIQGFFGNDIISGGGGGTEVYVVSAGNDIILDFNPEEDVLMTNDFGPIGKYEELGITTIRNLSDLQALSNDTMIDGTPALVIDVDGDLGDWTTTLMGVRLDQLGTFNVVFTFEEDAEDLVHPIPEFTHIPAIRMTATDGSVLTNAAHDLSVHPLMPELVSGSQEAFNDLVCIISYGGFSDEE